MDICQQLTSLLAINFCTIPVFYLGNAVGLICAVIGGGVEYKRMRARSRQGVGETHLPGCMIMMGGMLGFVGAIVLVISVFTGQFRDAMLLGWGVGAGFMLGFFSLVGIWALFLQGQEEVPVAPDRPSSQTPIKKIPNMPQEQQVSE